MPQWPVKQRELRNHHMDSTVWNDFAFRDDDIVIASYGKAGTTWLQQIVAQLVLPDADDRALGELSPWLDLRVPPAPVKLAALVAQEHRRIVKTHLPLDALVFSPRAKYLYIARDGRDVAWSLYNHHANANALWYEAINDTPGRVGPPVDPPPASVRDYFLAWLDGDGYPFWPFWENVASWWAVRDLPNVMLLHFEALRRDLAGEMRRIAAFLDAPVEADRFAIQVDHCGFAWMKAHAGRSAPLGGIFWDGGAETFIHKGTNGRWRDGLTGEDCRHYEALALERLGPACAAWLASGGSPA